MRTVNQPIRKKDAMQLLTGQPVYVNDLAPEGCLIVKLLRSPHPNAMIEEINTEAAKKVPGIEAVFTWEDVPQEGPRFTLAGQTYPEPSPQDRLVLDRHVRFIGDPVAIVAGKDEKCVDRALRMIKVKYQVLDAVLDFRTALDNPVLVHPEETWESLFPVGADNKRNLCAHEESSDGDVEAVLADCDVVLERTYHTKANQQTMMETFRTFCTIDTYGRLHIVSSTQIVFHCRRIVAKALGIPKAMVRVEKTRIGGGFGAKQTAVIEIYPAFVTWKTKKPCKLVYTRKETQTASSPRHEMELRVRLGAMKDGHIRAIDMYTLSNTGAYGEHGPTTVGLTGHKAIPMYGKTEAYRFACDVVYTNEMSAGAYRGYGATQGLFAVETTVNELAEIIHMDPIALREKNIVREGDVMPAYFGEVNTSCALDRCIARVREMIGWDEKYPCRDMGNGKVRGVGIGLALQGSGISGVDVGSAALKVDDEGYYTLRIGAADMGTGCDTILAQIAAEVLECGIDDITVFGADTDASPYDSGSYASSTTYVTGKAVERAALELREKICTLGAKLLGCDCEAVSFDGEFVICEESGKKVSRREITEASQCGNTLALEAVCSHSSPTSPPPFMAGAAEVEVDLETGAAEVIQFVAAVDCGTPVNPNLARVQAEGGILQGIGMTLTEDITYKNGRMLENSLMQYKIPTRQDIGHIRVEFESSYEEQGPFGAKSIGEVVINTPLPAITAAIRNATGLWFRELPITPEKILMGRLKQQESEETKVIR
ncbi:MAG: molybdopterin cofactor-binding domain-containing protein [Lachnospiraceae bacterium]|nr:molybdopterin cofactor-binding domain-containing protein [Lachnospiraceae bacterium]